MYLCTYVCHFIYFIFIEVVKTSQINVADNVHITMYVNNVFIMHIQWNLSIVVTV